MADPLSIAALVVSIVSFGSTVCKSVLDFYHSAKGSRQDVRDLCNSIERLQGTLNGLETVARRFSHHEVAAMVFQNLESCRLGLQLLAYKMEKCRKAMATPTLRSLPAMLQYPFKESTITRLREIVSQELVGHLNLAINILEM